VNHCVHILGEIRLQGQSEIGRYGDIGVRVQDPAVGALPVTASVDLRNMNAFVQTLPRVLPVRLEHRKNGVEIVSSRR
jgi:transmembrane sensor